jgi:hypothetical protein
MPRLAPRVAGAVPTRKGQESAVKQLFRSRTENVRAMDEARISDLSCAAKIARVVLENRGPLSPSEIAEEAYVSRERARKGVEDLESAGFAEPVCGMCAEKEEVFALTEAAEPSP